MTGGGSSSSSSSPSPTNPRRHLLPPPPPLNIPASHNGLPAAPKQVPPPQQQKQQPTGPPLLLTVRFSTSIPDLLLDIPHPRRTTVAALKHLIRSRLEQPNSQRRLRFIHGGKILPDNAVLSAVLKALPPPPSPSGGPTSTSTSTSTTTRDGQDPKGKGKGKGVDGHQQAQRVYVNCSIGDLLTDAELEEEKQRAAEPPPEQPPASAPGAAAAAAAAAAGSLSSPFQFQPGGPSRAHSPAGREGTTMRERRTTPRGFDRLLTAGFTAAEVNQLRLQFRSIQEARHTADTMPSPDTLRGMEDAWIDNNNDAGTGLAAAAAASGDGEGGEGGGVAAGGEEFGMAGVVDIMLRGMFIGFGWPLGALGWLVRDEEKIPKRMRVFVYFGFVLSLLIGTVRALG
ncbi:DSC E3 ubiquitin ligase complex subunit 3 [Cytospora mali]|uniref:DSC E3 ubiquitin ligase complex subunit 3 n=1 Tax=Cytospora mali TaxID=578113 RepID=A0A194WBS2_CYTMA|nr:DSC E3 ubiquitin ligase complex subunit 3 [Valsa mali]